MLESDGPQKLGSRPANATQIYAEYSFDPSGTMETLYTNLNILNPIFYEVLRLKFGAFRTSPLGSLYVDANEILSKHRQD